MNKKHLIIGIVIIVLSLYYAFRDVSVSELIGAFLSVRYVYILPALLFVVLSFFFRAVRWRYLVSPVKEVKLMRLLSPLIVGFMANMLPARAGEFIRAYLLSKKERISFSASFATIFIERLFDMSLVLLLLFWVLFFNADIFPHGDSGSSHRLMGYMVKFGWVSFTGCMFIFVFSVFLQFKYDWAMKIVNFCIKPIPHKWGDKITKLVHSFTEGLRIIKDKRGFLTTVFLSFLIWGCFVIMYYPLYLAFDINIKLPVITSLVVLCVTVAIFIALFPTPGFLGAFQAACVVALHEIFGVPKAVAASFGIIAWLVTMGFTVILGSIFVLKDHISFGEIAAQKEQIE